VILLACLVNGGAVAAVLIGRSEERSTSRASRSTVSPSRTPVAPFEIVREHPAAGPIDEWAQMRATDGSFAFYGPVWTSIVPIDPGDNADAAWRVTFPDAHPDCFLFVYDFEVRIGEPHAYAERILRSWLQECGRQVGASRSTHQGPVDGWAAYYRWGSSGWGENRVVVGDDRLYEFGCKADDQRSLEDGRRFTDSFEPTI
jgi:hypothetical protein